MPYVEAYVSGDEVLEEMSIEEIQSYLVKRQSKDAPAGSRETYDKELLEQIYLHYRGKDTPFCLREYIHRTLGRVL
jgi:hypothetical protein